MKILFKLFLIPVCIIGIAAVLGQLNSIKFAEMPKTIGYPLFAGLLIGIVVLILSIVGLLVSIDNDCTREDPVSIAELTRRSQELVTLASENDARLNKWLEDYGYKNPNTVPTEEKERGTTRTERT